MRRSFVGMLFVVVACSSSSTAPQSSGNNSTGNVPNTGGGQGTPTTLQVSIQEYSFSPNDITVKVGQLIQWTNDGTISHTVTSGSFGSGQLSPATGGGGYYGGSAGGTYSNSFSTPGTYNYHCANHPQMTGTITVTN